MICWLKFKTPFSNSNFLYLAFQVCRRGYGRGRVLRSSRRHGCPWKGLRRSWYGLQRGWRRSRWRWILKPVSILKSQLAAKKTTLNTGLLSFYVFYPYYPHYDKCVKPNKKVIGLSMLETIFLYKDRGRVFNPKSSDLRSRLFWTRVKLFWSDFMIQKPYFYTAALAFTFKIERVISRSTTTFIPTKFCPIKFILMASKFCEIYLLSYIGGGFANQKIWNLTSQGI